MEDLTFAEADLIVKRLQDASMKRLQQINLKWANAGPPGSTFDSSSPIKEWMAHPDYEVYVSAITKIAKHREELRSR